ncbi:Os07g0450100 [Oryza sativa Japonica Group]|uniref:Os07g0450100 protein n=1 Tax=Oryza sativa subsp. japonica TaxID=39947 RepID=A0A0P0X5Z1_ORYSJ|nr:Os07g0450100 [Oryza sativa Japonica Group]
MLLPNPQSPSQNPRHLRPKNSRCSGASSERYSHHVDKPASQRCRLLTLLAVDPVPLRHRRASGAAPFPWSHCSAPPPCGADRHRCLLVEPMVSTATNHLVHGHLLASCGCCLSASPHFSNCRYFTAQISFALVSIQV